METIWLQRSNIDIPWGFRLQGGRDYGVPLSVQRVTPGSVAAAGLCQGDLILKIGTISANDLSHMEGQELIKRAGNILQLTIRKSPVPMSPTGLYGSQVTAQLHDSNMPPQQNHHHPYPATHTALPDGSTRIQIQRSAPAQPVSSGPPLPPTPKVYEDSAPFSFSDSGNQMPDYTIPYRHVDPYRDGSAGGPYGVEDGSRPSQNNYTVAGSSMSLPRGVGGYGDRRQEARTLPINLTHQPAAPSPASSSQGQPVKFNPTQAYESRIGSSRYPDPLDEISAYPSSSAFSPAGASQPYSPSQQGAQPAAYSRVQVSAPYSEPSRPSANSYASSPYSPQVQQNNQQPSYNRAQQSPMSPTSAYSQQPSLQRGYSHEQPAGYGQDPQQRGYYDSQSYNRPESPQLIYQPQTPYQPQQYNSYSSKNSYEEPQPDPYTTPRPEAPPSYSQTFPRRQTSYERQASNDRSAYDRNQYNDGYVSNTVFNQQAGVTDFGYEESAGRGVPEPQRPQPYRPAEPAVYKPSVPQPYRPPEPVDSAYDGISGYLRQDSHPMSPGVRPVQPDFSKPSYSPQTSRDYDGRGGDYGPAPPPPPPPSSSALASGASWTPPRRSSQTRSVENDNQKVPDELLSSVLKSKGGGPKPFSYGVDLNELKKKIGPPTAPKTFRKKQSSPAGGQDMGDHPAMYSNKPAAGFIQSDYRRKPEEGPRAEIDTSPINISMGTNPKKQSMSFKVLQWMTDTENTPDEPDPPQQKGRRAPRDPTIHNAEDDEMRFTGLHPKTEIPSRSFKHLQKIPNESNQNHTAGGQQEESDDGLPDTLSPEEMSDRRYKGGHIPSKVFRTLQKAVGDETPETPPNEQQNGDAPAPRAAKAPSQDVTATDF